MIPEIAEDIEVAFLLVNELKMAAGTRGTLTVSLTFTQYCNLYYPNILGEFLEGANYVADAIEKEREKN